MAGRAELEVSAFLAKTCRGGKVVPVAGFPERNVSRAMVM
jgi:hypothetical protein